MTLLLAAVAVAQLAAAGAQTTPPPAAPAQSGAATARVSGTVRNAADDTPLARARVMVTSPALSDPRVAITGGDGKYSVAELPAGAYSITAIRTGYASYTYGQGRSVTGTPLSVANGQQLTDIDLPLAAGGVIAGRILDEDGGPLAGATVEALVRRVQGGSDMLYSIATAQTDDRGEFRLFGLAPGSYYVSAGDPAFANVGTPTGVLHYSPTYFPGTTQANQARTVTVGAGEPPRVEFKLQLVPPARVSGQIAAYDAKPLLDGVIVMTALASEGVPVVAREDPVLYPDGRFTFSGVQPGRYLIRARGQTSASGAALFASYSVEVFGDDLAGITMTLAPGAVVDGVVQIDPASVGRPELSALRVRAPFVDGTAFGDSPTGAVQANGTYALRGVMKGEHQIVVDGLPPAWVVKSVSYRGRDITDLQLSIDEREQLHDLRVVITDRAAEVSGVVRNARQRPVANAGVLVCSTVPVFWMRTSRRLRLTFTDKEGRWRVVGLPAGEYFAVASPFLDEADLGRRDRLEALKSMGTSFRVDSADARPTLALQLSSLVSAAAVR